MCRLFIHFSNGLLSRLTALVLLCVTLPGCLVMSPDDKGGLIGNIARGEPQKTACFGLSASVNGYGITRSWGKDYGKIGSGKKILSIPRCDLPKGCDTARFFLNVSAHELQVAEPICSDGWVTGIRPPLPDDSYPPCALLVSYGSFSGPPVFEGVAVTSAAGLVATSERQQPHPAVWVLFPVGAVVDSLGITAALLTLPLWAPPLIHICKCGRVPTERGEVCASSARCCLLDRHRQREGNHHFLPGRMDSWQRKRLCTHDG